MNNLQLLKIIETMDEKFDNMTQEQLDNYCCGNGLFAILEEAINMVITDSKENERFWNNYQHTTFEGTPCEDMRSYEILRYFWDAKLSMTCNRLFREARLEAEVQIENLLDQLEADGNECVGPDNRWSDYAVRIRDLL